MLQSRKGQPPTDLQEACITIEKDNVELMHATGSNFV